MPVIIEHRGNKWVVTDNGGHIYGSHPTKEEAEDQRDAINISKHKDEK